MQLDMSIKDGRLPYLQFEQREVGIDEKLTAEKGYPIPKISDVVLITPMGSKDIYEKEWPEWIADKKKAVHEGRYDLAWVEGFETSYRAWKAGKEAPVNGTPLESFAMLKKVQIDQIRKGGIHCIEDMAAANEDALQLVGMGARYYKTMCQNYLEDSKKGLKAKRLADAEEKIKAQDEIIQNLNDKLAELEKALKAK